MLLFFLPGPRWAKRRPRRRGTPGCWTPSTKSGTRSSGRTWRGSRPASGCTTRSTATRPSRSSSRNASSTEQSKRFRAKLCYDETWNDSVVWYHHRWRHSWSRNWALYPSLIFSDATLNSSWLDLIGKTACFEVCCNNGSEWFWNIIERTERQLSFSGDQQRTGFLPRSFFGSRSRPEDPERDEGHGPDQVVRQVSERAGHLGRHHLVQDREPRQKSLPCAGSLLEGPPGAARKS